MVIKDIETLKLSQETDFVITTRDLEAFGISIWAANRRVASGQWQRLDRGIYLTHPLNPSWRALARTALLIAGEESFLTHDSAWFVQGMTSKTPELISVGFLDERRISPRKNMMFQKRTGKILVSGLLPATILEETVLDLAEDGRDVLDIIGLLTRGFHARMNRNRLLYVLRNRVKYSQRKLLLELLGEVVDGVEPPLEYSYDTRVEQAHMLPRSRRQVLTPVAGKWIRTDRVFEIFQVRIELDGQYAHPGGRTDQDVWRDNAILLKTGDITLRYRWANVIGKPCETAGQIVEALKQRGWEGVPKKCGPQCTVLEYRP